MSEATNAVPNPGSYRAQEMGCTCAVIDNHYGDGFETPQGRRFWIMGGCPVHAPIGTPREPVDDKERRG